MSRDYLPGVVVLEPSEEYAVERRFWQGCPTVLCTPGGRLFAAWYSGGVREPAPDQYNILARSDDGGLSWTEPVLVVDSLPEKKVRAIDVQLWRDPQNRMWMLWVTRDDNFKEKEHPQHLKTWAIICDDPDAEELTWSEPRFISPGFLRTQPTVLSDGRYLLCAYDWTCDKYAYSESSDQGETWVRKFAGKKLGAFFDETMILERCDGSLWMLARSGLGCLVESISTDGGATWSDGEASSIVAPSSRFFIQRLPSGNVLLVYNAHRTNRCMMTAALSENDGKTWAYSLTLDPGTDLSYPDMAVMPDGSLYIVYDHDRRGFKEIVSARITEEDIKAGQLLNKSSFLKNIISKAPAEPYDQAAFERQQEREKAWQEELGMKL